MHTELLFSSTRYRVNQLWREQQRHRTRISRSNTSNILAERMVEGGGGGGGGGGWVVWWTKSQSWLLNVYFRLSGSQSSLLFRTLQDTLICLEQRSFFYWSLPCQVQCRHKLRCYGSLHYWSGRGLLLLKKRWTIQWVIFLLTFDSWHMAPTVSGMNFTSPAKNWQNWPA